MKNSIIRQIINFFTFKGYQKFRKQISNHLNRYKLSFELFVINNHHVIILVILTITLKWLGILSTHASCAVQLKNDAELTEAIVDALQVKQDPMVIKLEKAHYQAEYREALQAEADKEAAAQRWVDQKLVIKKIVLICAVTALFLYFNPEMWWALVRNDANYVYYLPNDPFVPGPIPPPQPTGPLPCSINFPTKPFTERDALFGDFPPMMYPQAPRVTDVGTQT